MDSQITIQEPVKFADAFAVRQSNFDNRVHFFAPGLKKYEIKGFKQTNPVAFLPISLTGNACALDCDHCDTKILDPMIPLNQREGIFELCQKMADRGTEAVLISGGSMKNGQVPFLKHIPEIKRIKNELGFKIIMHTGLVNEEMAIALKDAGVDGVALDIIGAQETIEQVYHMNATVEDFEQSMKLLTDHGLSIRPHIILGLHYGQFLGEYKALEMISKFPVHALIIVILTPLHDTPMQNVSPPPVDEVGRFLHDARIKMPDSKILIGCARPGGEYKKQVDLLAIQAGMNGIAYPAEGIIDYAENMGLKPVYFENSCSCGID
jgi:lipoyl synthase